MKSNWKRMAASLAVLIGVSGAAFGADQNRPGRDNRPPAKPPAKVEQHDVNRNAGRNVARVDDHSRDWNRGRPVVEPVYRAPVYRRPVYTAPV